MLMYLRGLLDVNKKFLLNFYTFISSNWILFLNGFEVIRNIAQILKFIKFANFVNIIQNLFFNPRWFQINRECDHLNPCNQSKYIHILINYFRYILINLNIFEIFDKFIIIKKLNYFKFTWITFIFRFLNTFEIVFRLIKLLTTIALEVFSYIFKLNIILYYI